MKSNDFHKLLRESLSQPVFEPSHDLKGIVMRCIHDLQWKKEEQRLMSALRKWYQPPHSDLQVSLKASLMASLPSRKQVIPWSEWTAPMFPVLRRVALSSFAFLLAFVLALSPLLVFQAGELIEPVEATAFLECSGPVLVNGKSCQLTSLTPLSPGDSVVTEQNGFATIYYDPVTLVRLDTATSAKLQENTVPTLRLSSGSVWVHAPVYLGEEALQIETVSVKATVPQGDAGIRADGNLTKLLASTAAVEVEVQKNSGTTELMTLPPDKKLIVRQSKYITQVRQTNLDPLSQEWVTKHQQKDNELAPLFAGSSFELSLVPDAAPELSSLISQKILESYRAVSKQNTTLAKSLLMEVSLILDWAMETELMSATDYAVLNEIAKKSSDLKPLSIEIKTKQLEKLRSIVFTPIQSSPESATADSKSILRIVGEANKEQNKQL